MAYTDSLTSSQKTNMNLLLDEMNKQGVTNPLTKAAMLSVVSKETEFNPAASEVSYAGTSNDRIRKIFSKTKTLSDTDLTKLKSNPQAFFDFVYNGIAGNGIGDGYKFRGRGFNQLTGRANYANVGKMIGVDLVNNPDLLSQPDVAAKAMVAYFIDGVNTLKRIGKLSAYNASDINDFKTLPDSVGAMYNVNAGPGTSLAVLNADATGGRKKATERSSDIFSLLKAIPGNTIAGVQTVASATYNEVKKKPLTALLITVTVVIGSYFLYEQFKKK